MSKIKKMVGQNSMALNPSNISNSEQLALKGLNRGLRMEYRLMKIKEASGPKYWGPKRCRAPIQIAKTAALWCSCKQTRLTSAAENIHVIQDPSCQCPDNWSYHRSIANSLSNTSSSCEKDKQAQHYTIMVNVDSQLFIFIIFDSFDCYTLLYVSRQLYKQLLNTELDGTRRASVDDQAYASASCDVT